MTPTDTMDTSDDGQRRSQSRKTRETSSSQNNGSTTIESVLNTLQPLRDLAQNWDVDIASCLEEYLEELTSLRLEGEGQPREHQNNHRGPDGTGLAPNFAQAALLLQNSSNVYSRKVEYLYSLVYKALDEFFKETSANKNSSSSSRRKSADASIDDFFNFDPHVEFLLLDDVVPVELESQTNKSSKIDLPPTLQHDDAMAELAGGDVRTPSTNQSLILNRTRLSLGGLSVTRVDRSATRISTGSGPGSSGPSSSQQRALLGTLNSGSLRLVDGRCDIGDDGVLLMPGSSTGPASCPAQAIASLAGSIERLPTQQGLRLQVGLGPEQPSDTMQPMELDYDGDDDGPGFYFAGDDDVAGESTDGRGGEGVAQATGARTERPHVTFPNEPQQSSPKRKSNKPDPWSLLDPHVVDQADYKHNKPLRKGKTYLLPSGLDEPPSQCVTGASTRRVSSRRPTQPAYSSHRRDSVASLCFTAQAFRATLHRRNHTNSLHSVESGSSHTSATNGSAASMWQVRPPLTGLAFGTEFEYIAKETAKRRAAERRDIRKQRPELHQETTERQQQEEQDQYDDNDDYGGGFDFGGDDDGDDGEVGDYVGTNDGLGNNAGVASLADAFSSVGVGGQEESESNFGPKTFEELCRAHIEAFAKGAQEYALSTQLTDRVNQWQSKLAPILEDEEKRAEFDIHEYAARVIRSAQFEVVRRKSDVSEASKTTKSSSMVKFDVVTRDCTQFDVCRMFLASLSLANSGNVQVDENSTIEDFQFLLLSSDVNRPMETYRAPSVTQDEE